MNRGTFLHIYMYPPAPPKPPVSPSQHQHAMILPLLPVPQPPMCRGTSPMMVSRLEQVPRHGVVCPAAKMERT
jgi:hypothetical protein